MEIVAAKCTECGANIEVDSTKEAAVCKYCGTAFITEKAIYNYNTHITNNNKFANANINIVGGDIKNFLEIANNSLQSRNGKEAFEYANKALEIKTDSSKAWLLKMKSLEFIGTVGDTKVAEVITCGKNAIQYATDDSKEDTEKEVYKYYLNRSLSLLILATHKIKDVEQINQTFQTFATISALTAGDRTSQVDRTLVNLMEALSNNALLLKLEVPVDIIKNNDEYQLLVKAIANQYILYSQGLTERFSVYGTKLLDSAVESRKMLLTSFKEGLSEANINEVSADGINNKTNNNGCYIATCIYGSYDCPQVWTLRRFRDYTLRVTWYGRIFIKLYYTMSPKLVKQFGETKWFIIFFRNILDKIVDILYNEGIENTYYHDDL